MVSSVLVSHTTYVAGFVHDQTASSRAVSEGANNAVGTNTSSSQRTAGTANNVTISARSITNYNGLADGAVNETYTVTVISGSTGGDATTAALRVRSASGLDDQNVVVPHAFGSATPIGTRGLTATWTTSGGSEFVAGQTWEIVVSQNYTAAVGTVSGTYTGPSDTTYIVEVTKGGLYATSPQITVSTTTGIDVGGPYEVTAAATPVVIGAYGLSIQFSSTGLSKGDKFLIECTAAAPAAVKTIVLGKNLPASLLTGNLNVTLYIKKNIEVSENRLDAPGVTNFSTSATEIIVSDGITAADSTWVDDDGALIPLPVVSGTLYVQYRAFRAQCTDQVYAAETDADVVNLLGKIDKDNDLALGVSKAIANSNGIPVLFMAVADNSLESYIKVLEMITERSDVYSIVPLTFDRIIQDEVASHVKTMSSPENGRWRITWVCTQGVPEIVIAKEHTTSEHPLLATISDDPNTTNTQYTLVELDTSGEVTPLSFIEAGVAPGDILRVNYTVDAYGNPTYSEYVVDVVISDDSLRLVSGPAVEVSPASKIEIWRVLDSGSTANYVGDKAGSFYSRRVYNVWPDQVEEGDQVYPGYILAAALAGLKSGVLPHQGLTNLEVVGFDSMLRTTKFLSTLDMNTMASQGVLIVTQNPAGKIYTRHQVSTDTLDINMRELTVTTNVDSISYVALQLMEPYIGISNVTPGILRQLSVEFAKLYATFQQESIARLGPQLLGLTISRLEVHPILKDRIVAVLNITIPYPLNNIEVHLVV